MKLEIQPLYDRVVARRLDPIVETEGGLEIPEMAQEKPQEGTVLSVGPGRVNPATGEFISMMVRPKDKILFGKYAGIEIETDRGAIVILREDEILGIVKKGSLHPTGVRALPNADSPEETKRPRPRMR